MLGNDDAQPWVVQKFGGTSVGKFPVNIARDIIKESLSRNRVVVVCSARSTGKKVEGTTSRLLQVYNYLHAISINSGPDDPEKDLVRQAQDLVLLICQDHLAAVERFIQNEDIRKRLGTEIEAECDELAEYISAAKRFRLEVNSRSKDRVVSYGEKLSCRFMTALLQDYGVDAEYVDLADILSYDLAPRLDASFYETAIDLFRQKLSACGHRVPVVTGFFGHAPGGLIDGDIGRGYTDLCAALCAVCMGAEELQVWKEVDGIFTADPRKVPTARLLPAITPSEAAELTFYGSEVIHHLTMDQVMHASPPIPIRIKNVKNPRGNGTVVIPEKSNEPVGAEKKPVIMYSKPRGKDTPTDESSSRPLTPVKPKRPTAVTIKDHITVINVHSNKRSLSHGFFARIFSILHTHRITVDLISTSEVHVSMAIHGAASTTSQTVLFERALEELVQCGEVTVLHGMAILSLVGAEMKNMLGIAGKMFRTLGEYNINIEMISQGASEINISCVIDVRDATRAMNVLHTHLFTFLE